MFTCMSYIVLLCNTIGFYRFLSFAHAFAKCPWLRIASVDQFQGREKDLIIFSAVRCNRRISKSVMWCEWLLFLVGRWWRKRHFLHAVWLQYSKINMDQLSICQPSPPWLEQDRQCWLFSRLASIECDAHTRAAWYVTWSKIQRLTIRWNVSCRQRRRNFDTCDLLKSSKWSTHKLDIEDIEN